MKEKQQKSINNFDDDNNNNIIGQKILDKVSKKIKNNNDNINEKQDLENKYIVICGGCVSGLGKGITTSSIGYLLKKSGKKVTVVKIDPYLNIDAGTMNPFEHGECYVTDDGGEVDLDIGNYERYLDIRLSKDNNITTGKVYQEILMEKKEKKTYQLLPDLNNKIVEMIKRQSKGFEITLIEIGGTVGDIESRVFYESIRTLIYELGKKNVCLALVTYVPMMSQSGEQKTKPTQQACTQLRSYGLQPDIIICRSDKPLDLTNLNKISMYSGVKINRILNNQDVKTTLGVPLVLQEQGIIKIIDELLNLNIEQTNIIELQQYLIYQGQLSEKNAIRIAVVGKYTELRDTYMSVIKALQHSGVEAGVNLQIQMVESAELENIKQGISWDIVKNSHGVLVPGGFGVRGNQGIIDAIQYLRENKKPFLGICFGFQMAVIEFSRNVLNQPAFTSQEFDPDQTLNVNDYVIAQMNHLDNTMLGGTMRKGLKTTLILNENTLAYKIYGKLKIEERHRHRYEVNPNYTQFLQQKGLKFSGIAEDDTRRNIILELEDHPFFFATQFHPELLSRQFEPSPPVLAFILAAAGIFQSKIQANQNHTLQIQQSWRNIKIPQQQKQLSNFVQHHIKLSSYSNVNKSFEL